VAVHFFPYNTAKDYGIKHSISSKEELEPMASRWFRHDVRVRYQETDQMGVVYHANYLNWFELGRTEMIRELGMPYRELEERGLLLPVVEAELQFRAPARYDDSVTIYTAVEEYNHLRLQFTCEVRRLTEEEHGLQGGATEPQGELLVRGRTKHIWVNRDWRPVRIDRAAPDLFELLGQVIKFT
jgi:acyl-CoA thioester hydrolase